MIATSGFLTALECTKFDFGRGSAPNPAGGAYSTPPGPLPGLRDPTSKGRGGKGTGKEGKGGRGRGRGGQGTREWEGRGRDAKERGGKAKGRKEGKEGRDKEGRKVRTPPLSISVYAPVGKCLLLFY